MLKWFQKCVNLVTNVSLEEKNMKREEDRNTVIRDIRTQLGLIAETALSLQARVDSITEKPTTLGKWFARKGPTPVENTEAVSSPITETEPVQFNVFKADDRIELLPVPSVSAATPDIIAQHFNRGALEALRAKALASNNPQKIARWQTIAEYTNLYLTGKTIDQMSQEMNLTHNQCYGLRNHGFAPHTYGAKIKQGGARNMGGKHGKKVAKKNKVRMINRTSVKPDVRTLSDITERIEAATSEATTKPSVAGKSSVPSPSSLYLNADPTLVANFNSSPLWPRYNGFTSGTPVEGDSVNAYNMDYAAVSMYLHGMPTSEISSQLQIDVKPLINSMFE